MSALIKKNVGTADGIIRIIFACGIGILSYIGWISEGTAMVNGVVAIIALITGFVNFCPIYHALGIKTREEPLKK